MLSDMQIGMLRRGRFHIDAASHQPAVDAALDLLDRGDVTRRVNRDQLDNNESWEYITMEAGRAALVALSHSP